MSAMVIVGSVIAVLLVVMLLVAAAWRWWRDGSSAREIARVRAEEQLLLWELQAMGHNAAEAMRRAAEEVRREQR